MSRQKLKTLVIITLAITWLMPAVLIQAKTSKKTKSIDAGSSQSVPSVILQNEFLQVAAVAPEVGCVQDCFSGTFVIGTTGGNPASASDDNHPLLYWDEYGTEYWDAGSSYATLRVITALGEIDDVILGYTDWNDGIAPVQPPSTDGSTLTTIWEYAGVRVVEALSFAQNPYTGNRDTTAITYTLTNLSSEALQAGIRLLLDVDVVAGSDYYDAPIYIPGIGEILTQAEWDSTTMPAVWTSYDIFDFRVVARGELTGLDATTPDRFVVTDFQDAYNSFESWDFPEIDPERPDLYSDTAVLIYYNPLALQPEGSITLKTYVGLGHTNVFLPLILK